MLTIILIGVLGSINSSKQAYQLKQSFINQQFCYTKLRIFIQTSSTNEYLPNSVQDFMYTLYYEDGKMLSCATQGCGYSNGLEFL